MAALRSKSGASLGQRYLRNAGLIKQEINQKGIHVAVIGPAAEHGICSWAFIAITAAQPARTGLGAVMASKNLKAIAVLGNAKPPLVYSDRYAPLRSESNRTLKQDNEARILHEMGTSSVANYAEYLGSMPAKYYHQGGFNPWIKSPVQRWPKRSSRGKARATPVSLLVDGWSGSMTASRKGPEYETIISFGPNLLIDDLNEIVRIGELCDRYGMDTISTGNTIGLAFYLFELGKSRCGYWWAGT